MSQETQEKEVITARSLIDSAMINLKDSQSKNKKEHIKMKQNGYEIVNECVIQEGFIGGFLTEIPEELYQFFSALTDLTATTNPSKVFNRIQKVIQYSKNEVNNSSFEGIKHIPNLLIYRAVNAYWRYYFILDDETFNKILQSTKQSGKDTSGWFDLNIPVRAVVASKLLKANSKSDIIKQLDLYSERTKLIFDEIKKNPSNSGLRPLLRTVLYGVRDLSFIVNRLISYHS
jgi:hypothetical protein